MVNTVKSELKLIVSTVESELKFTISTMESELRLKTSIPGRVYNKVKCKYTGV